MASSDQGPYYVVIGIINILMTFWNIFFLILGVALIVGGICLSQQKVIETVFTSQLPSSQPQPAVQQTAPSTHAPPQLVKEPEKAKFWSNCGSPKTENFIESCGAKID
ncbi:hypothetical protein ES703_31267 [subsurface metagenome]